MFSTCAPRPGDRHRRLSLPVSPAARRPECCWYHGIHRRDIGEPQRQYRFVQPQLLGAQQQFGVQSARSQASINLLPGLLEGRSSEYDAGAVLHLLAVDVPHRLTRRALFLIEVHRLNQTRLVFLPDPAAASDGARDVGGKWKVPTPLGGAHQLHLPPV